jgi:hypothetical protein
MLAATPVEAGVFTLTNANCFTPGCSTSSSPEVFDGNSRSRYVTVTGAEVGFDSGILTGLSIAIDYVKADGEGPFAIGPFPGEPFFNEIHFRVDRAGEPSTTLIAPGTYAVGAPGTFFRGVQTFETGGAAIAVGSTPVVGTFSPTGPGALTAYNGLSTLGDWGLLIHDTERGNALRFHSVSFTFTTAPVPEPSNLWLFGTGSVALLLRSRRKRA